MSEKTNVRTAVYNWIKTWWTTLTPILAWLLPVFFELAQDVLYKWLILTGTLCLLIVTFIALRRTKLSDSELDLSDANNPRRADPFIFPKWTQTITVVLIFGNLLLIGKLGFIERDSDPFAFAFIGNVERPYGMSANVGDVWYAAGDMVVPEEDDPNTVRSSFFLTNAYYVRFNVRKATRLGTVKVQKILVTVEDCKQVGKAWFPASVRPIDDESLFLVEIEDPQKSRERIFTAERFFEQSDSFQTQLFAPTILDNNEPAPFVLRVDAKSPGLYKFTIQIEVSNGFDRQFVTVILPEEPDYGIPEGASREVLYQAFDSD